MRKSSHLLVARKAVDFLGIRGMHRLMFYFGSLYPDLVPSMFTKTHTFENWYPWVEKRWGSASYFTEGRLLHFCCDFFTRVHNEGKYLSISHARYEKDLRDYLKANSVVPRLNMSNSLKNLHTAYLRQGQDVSCDRDYCCIVLGLLLISMCRSHTVGVAVV